MSEIRTRKYNRGAPKESSWPPMFGKQSTRNKYTRKLEKKTKAQVNAVHQDTMEPIEHPAEPGKLIESRSQFRAITKRHGLEEVGNEKLGKVEPKFERMSDEAIQDDIKKAINDCRWGNSGLSEYERHRCKEIDRRRNNHG